MSLESGPHCPALIMLSEHSIAALQHAAQAAMQEGLSWAAFDEVGSAVRAVVDSVIAAAGEARNAQQAQKHRMPPELLAATFLHMGLSDRVTSSHVCRFWRSIALSSPPLWADIRVTSMDRSGNADRANRMLRTLLGRTGTVPVHFTLNIRHPPVRPHEMSLGLTPRPVFGGLIDITPLVPRASQIDTINLDLHDERLIDGWKDVLSDLPRVRHMSLRFRTHSDLRRTGHQAFHGLPQLVTLEIWGSFIIPQQVWPPLPSLKHLRIREGLAQDVAAVSLYLLPACPALETLKLVSVSGFLMLPRPAPPQSAQSLSSLMLRGPPEVGRAYRDLILALRCEAAPHIALQRTDSGTLPPIAEWTAAGFAPVALCLLRPPREIGFRFGADRAVARFEDAEGRSRTCILSAPTRFFLGLPSVAGITRLVLDECDLNPDEFPQTSALLPALAAPRIRLVEDLSWSRRLFRPRGLEGGLMRIDMWKEDYQGEWRCSALQKLELAYLQGSRAGTVACADVVYLLDRLCAPAAVQLRLQNLGINDPPDSRDYDLLRRRVSLLTMDPEYRPHAVERDWESWRVEDDMNV